MNLPIEITNSQIKEDRIDFHDLPTEQITNLAQQATQDAVKRLHQKDICTYGIKDDIIYETNPITQTRSVAELLTES